MDYKIDIVQDRDHYVVKVDGEFFCTADTHQEAVQELQAEGYFM